MQIKSWNILINMSKKEANNKNNFIQHQVDVVINCFLVVSLDLISNDFQSFLHNSHDVTLKQFPLL